MDLCKQECVFFFYPTKQPSIQQHLDTSQVNRAASELGGNGQISQKSVDRQRRPSTALNPAESFTCDRKKGAYTSEGGWDGGP